jgi:hypothetical protein
LNHDIFQRRYELDEESGFEDSDEDHEDHDDTEEEKEEERNDSNDTGAETEDNKEKGIEDKNESNEQVELSRPQSAQIFGISIRILGGIEPIVASIKSLCDDNISIGTKSKGKKKKIADTSDETATTLQVCVYLLLSHSIVNDRLCILPNYCTKTNCNWQNVIDLFLREEKSIDILRRSFYWDHLGIQVLMCWIVFYAPDNARTLK